MRIKHVAIIVLVFFLLSTYPVLAKVTVLNKTDYRIDLVIKDTRSSQSYSLNPDERESFSCQESGGQLIMYRKQEEVLKKSFDDGDKYIIKFEDGKFTIKKVNDF